MGAFDSQSAILGFESALRPFAFSLTKSKEETDDLIQETFYRALRNQEKFDEGTNIKAWLFTIMRNIFINNYRRDKRRVVVKESADKPRLLEYAGPSVSNGSEKEFMADTIRNAMKEVNKDFTEPFLMYNEGFHYHEISEKLDIPLGTVKSRIFVARRELRSRLQKLGILDTVVE
jgi:RNA polymerase sigma-70 factor (ECF subfamily)